MFLLFGSNIHFTTDTLILLFLYGNIYNRFRWSPGADSLHFMETGRYSDRELSKQTGLAMYSLTALLDHMEVGDLIRRELGEKDRGEILIYLTETSRKLELDYRCLMYEINSIYFKDFNEWDKRIVESYLRRILENVQDAL